MTLDERIEALTQTVELMARMQTDAFAEYDERFLHQRNIDLAEHLDRYERKLLALAERHSSEMAEIRHQLERAVRLSLPETPNELRRRQELAAEALKLLEGCENSLKAFLQRGGNGLH